MSAHEIAALSKLIFQSALIYNDLRRITASLCLLSLLLSLLLLLLPLNPLLRHAGAPGNVPSPPLLILLNHQPRRLLLRQRERKVKGHLPPSLEEERLEEGKQSGVLLWIYDLQSHLKVLFYCIDRQANMTKNKPPTKDKTDITMYVNFSLTLIFS